MPLDNDKPVISSADISPVAKHFSLLLGYLLFLHGGTVTMPPMTEIKKFLQENFGIDNHIEPDGKITLTLIPHPNKEAERAN